MIEAIQQWWREQVRKQAFREVITPVQGIDIIRGDGMTEHDVLCQVDLLRDETLIDARLAKDLGLYVPETINERKEVVDPEGKKILADVIPASFTIQGAERTSRWFVVDRAEAMHLVVLGKRDTAGFYVLVQSAQK